MMSQEERVVVLLKMNEIRSSRTSFISPSSALSPSFRSSKFPGIGTLFPRSTLPSALGQVQLLHLPRSATLCQIWLPSIRWLLPFCRHSPGKKSATGILPDPSNHLQPTCGNRFSIRKHRGYHGNACSMREPAVAAGSTMRSCSLCSYSTRMRRRCAAGGLHPTLMIGTQPPRIPTFQRLIRPPATFRWSTPRRPAAKLAPLGPAALLRLWRPARRGRSCRRTRRATEIRRQRLGSLASRVGAREVKGTPRHCAPGVVYFEIRIEVRGCALLFRN